MDEDKMQTHARDLTIGLSLATCIVAIISAAAHYFCYSYMSHHQINIRMSNTYDLAKSMVVPLWSNDSNMIRQISEAILTCAYISGIRVETDLGEIIYENHPEGEDRSLIREEMIRQSDHYFGKLRLQFTDKGVKQIQKQTIIIVSIMILPVILIVMIGGYFTIRHILNRPLARPNHGKLKSSK